MKTLSAYQCFACTLLFAVYALGCHRQQTSSVPKADASQSATVRVAVTKPQRKTLLVTTTQPARIEAFEDTPIHSKLSGYVEKVNVDIGDKVSRDQPLLVLHVPELADDVRQKTALVAQAEAQLKQAEANIEAAKSAVETSEAKVSEADAGLSKADSEAERWKSEYKRVKELAEGGALTEKVADETLNQLRAAEATQEAAKSTIRSAKAGVREANVNVTKAGADREAAAARLNVCKADLAHANTMLDYATIRSPFDGVVTKRNVDTGHFVQPASSATTPLLDVARTDQVRVFVEVPELEASSVEVGHPATIQIQALPGKKIESTVTRTSWSLNDANRSLNTEIDVSNPEMKLRPGMYGTVTVQRDKRENVLVIPTSATFNKDDKTCVASIQNDKASITEVKLGLRSGQEIEVVSGLGEDDVVVSSQGDKLSDGQLVEISGKM